LLFRNIVPEFQLSLNVCIYLQPVELSQIHESICSVKCKAWEYTFN